MTFFKRRIQCVVISFTLSVDVDFFDEQHLHYLIITSLRRHIQFVVILFILSVDVDSFGEQHLHHLLITSC